MFKSRRIKEEEPRRDEPETEERSAAKKVGGSSSNIVISFQRNEIGEISYLQSSHSFANKFVETV
jgi:hypothetical protein